MSWQKSKWLFCTYSGKAGSSIFLLVEAGNILPRNIKFCLFLIGTELIQERALLCFFNIQYSYTLENSVGATEQMKY